MSRERDQSQTAPSVLCPHNEAAGKSCRVVAKPPTDGWKLGGLSRVAMAVWLL